MRKDEFRRRRRQLMKMMGKGGIAILPAVPEKARNGDVHYHYRPDSDFFYLTGFAEPEAVAVLIPGRAQAEYVHLRDPRPAGLEPPITVSKYHWDLGLIYYEEVRDTASNFFIEWLPAGEYTLKYRLRANLAGTFRVGPATLQSMYAPEFAAFSAGHVVTIGGDKK